MSFDARREQRNRKRANSKEDTQEIQHWAALGAIEIGHENVRASIQAASAQSEQDCSHARRTKGMGSRKQGHRQGDDQSGYEQIPFIAQMIDQRTDYQRSTENTEIKQQKQASLLCQINL